MFVVAGFLLALSAFAQDTPSSTAAKTHDPAGLPLAPEWKNLKYRNIGPSWGGRAARSTGVPGDPSTFYVATAQSGVWKTCERDIPMAVARQANAATTAGASLAIAAACGIRVFVTGGIGAVGPQASGDFDISADLPAIAGYPVVTVCAGAKAFMDVAATLEWLETHRVPVATWRSQEFPLFFCRHSGCRNEWAAESAEEIAAVYRAQRELGVEAGLLVAVPLPESEALEEPEARAAINEAFEWAKGGGVTGKQLTPFLLAKISELTGGRSLQSNVALIRNNAEVGAGIAVALSA